MNTTDLAQEPDAPNANPDRGVRDRLAPDTAVAQAIPTAAHMATADLHAVTHHRVVTAPLACCWTATRRQPHSDTPRASHHGSPTPRRNSRRADNQPRRRYEGGPDANRRLKTQRAKPRPPRQLPAVAALSPCPLRLAPARRVALRSRAGQTPAASRGPREWPEQEEQHQ
jgi:hypothetical protein